MVRENQLVHGARKVPSQKDNTEERGYCNIRPGHPSLGPVARNSSAVRVESVPYNLQHDEVRLLQAGRKLTNYFCSIQHDPAQNVNSQVTQSPTTSIDRINQITLLRKVDNVARKGAGVTKVIV